eukprot:m.216724 g.216724  ORF g.216724 m.216724 type:complete len:233 (-) comp13809_c3_seq3:1896-2594(-)
MFFCIVLCREAMCFYFLLLILYCLSLFLCVCVLKMMCFNLGRGMARINQQFQIAARSLVANRIVWMSAKDESGTKTDANFIWPPEESTCKDIDYKHVRKLVEHNVGIPKQQQPYYSSDGDEVDDSFAVILDVREPHEFVVGHIPTAINFPLSTCATMAEELGDIEEVEQVSGITFPSNATPSTLPLVVYCNHGIRSGLVQQLFLQSGWTNVTNYKGSWDEWCNKDRSSLESS